MITQVTDLTVDELKILIHETVNQALLEAFDNFDKDLELQEDFVTTLTQSLETFKTKNNTIPAKNVADKLGLNW